MDDLAKQQKADKAFRQLLHETAELVEARHLGRFGGVEYLDGYVLFFHGPDAEALAASLALQLGPSDVVTSLRLIKRFGPPGSPKVVQTIKPAR